MLALLRHFFAVLLLALIPLLAQQAPGQWVDDYFMVDTAVATDGLGTLSPGKRFLDDNNRVDKIIPSITELKATDFPVERKYLVFATRSFWRNDGLYTCALGPSKTENGIRYSRYTIAKYTDDTWKYVGGFECESTTITVIPCDNNRFIAITSQRDLTGNKGIDRSPFAVLSVGQNERIKVSHALPPMYPMNNPDSFRLPSASSMAVTDRHAVLINPKTGLYWIFSLEKASLTRSGRIFEFITDKMISEGGVAKAVLCVQPEKDGNILISARNKEAILKSGDFDKELTEMITANPDLLPEDTGKMIQKRRIERANKDWQIEWYRINPEKGNVVKLKMPPLGNPAFRDGTNDLWRPMPDGSVKIGLKPETVTLNK